MVADAVLRQFLLDRVDAEERQRIELLFITDPSFNERVRALEQDLIDDYLEGSLAEGEQDSFRRQYAGTAQQLRKLSVSKSVKEWADSQTTNVVLQPKRGWLRPGVVPIAAALLVAILVLGIWINSRLEHRRQVANEQELARINDREAMTATPAGLHPLTLSPVNTRAEDSGSEVDTQAAQLIELRLLWIQKEHYPSYSAVIRKVGGTEALTIQTVYADSNNQNVIRVRIPSKLLSRGQFRIVLSGGSEGLSDEYVFSVSR